jgi:acyl-CoA dehydrogenase
MTMQLELTDDQHQLQQELRAYFAKVVDEVGGGSNSRSADGRGHYKDYIARLGDDGMLGLGWPVEYGGQARPLVEQMLFIEESHRAGVPLPLLTLNSVGPTIMALGSDEQKARFLPGILKGRIHFAIGYTEPGAGTDLAGLETKAVLDGDEFVINGQKVFTSVTNYADYVWLAVRTDPDAPKHKGISVLIVPVDAPGFSYTPIHTMGGEPTYATYYADVRVPKENLVGNPGDGFRLAQQRLGPGRIHHAMRWLGQSKRAFDMLCERAVSRYTHGSVLADKQMVQDWVALSAAEMRAARLMTLHAAWTMDQVGAANARVEIAMIKYWGARVLHDVIDRAIQVHGSLGFSGDLPLESMYRAARAARIYDGPDEVHKATVARRILRGYTPVDVPSEHVPTRTEAARKKFAEYLEGATANL